MSGAGNETNKIKVEERSNWNEKKKNKLQTNTVIGNPYVEQA